MPHRLTRGEELLRHELAATEEGSDLALTQVSWQQVDDLMVVAWPPAPDQQEGEVVVYRRDGQQVRSIDVEVHAYPDLLLEAANPYDAIVFASAPDGLIRLDPETLGIAEP